MLTPKSRKPRWVDTSRELRRVLLQLRDDRLVKAFANGKSDISDELVFPSEAGTPIEMNNFSERVFKPLLARAGLRRIRFHDLRHTTPLAACLSRQAHRLLTCGTRGDTAPFKLPWTPTAT
jgi:integrase